MFVYQDIANGYNYYYAQRVYKRKITIFSYWEGEKNFEKHHSVYYGGKKPDEG